MYKELSGYFDLHGTYATPTPALEENQVMHHFNVNQGNLGELLAEIEPTIVISSLRGDFAAQTQAHNDLITYAATTGCLIYLLSTVNVFDAKKQFVSYELDLPRAESDYGKFKIGLEKVVSVLPKGQFGILRLPMVLGLNSTRIVQLIESYKHKAAYEVYPNLIISAISDQRLARQIHYIVNQRLSGIYHLSSKDVMHHGDLIIEISEKLGLEGMVYKQNYRSNTDEYLAILAKKNRLPKQFRFTMNELINEITLKEEIVTLKTNLQYGSNDNA